MQSPIDKSAPSLPFAASSARPATYCHVLFSRLSSDSRLTINSRVVDGGEGEDRLVAVEDVKGLRQRPHPIGTVTRHHGGKSLFRSRLWRNLYRHNTGKL